MVIPLTIHLNARLDPDARRGFDDLLLPVLAAHAPGSEITGGGALLSHTGEPQSCDIEIDLEGDPEASLAAVIKALSAYGAPRGSSVTLGDEPAIPFGEAEGVALYLNGTDLPEEVYASSDPNELIGSLTDSLGREGSVVSYWEGPQETALYLYGRSASRMRELIGGVLASHPLGQRSRLADLT
ncbi:MAG TPA: hypothetical protein VMU95_16655 [Trebonia sp.]|nr:hypothetical protein [Trebonia sp.]